MKIIKRTSDNVVLFAGNDLVLDENGVHGNGWTCRVIDAASVQLVNVADIPEQFMGGGWAYEDGTWTPNAIADQAILPGKKAAKIEELKAGYVSEVYSPISHAGFTWGTDPDSRNLLGQVLAVGSVPEGMYWRDVTSTPRPMTYADLQALAYAILERGLAADENLMTKTTTVNAATTAAEIDAVSW